MLKRIFDKLAPLEDVALLLFRLSLAYVFWETGMEKWSDIEATAAWFGNEEWGLGIPLPTFNAYLAASTEVLGVLLLTLGLGSRYIALPLIGVLLVAILTVHMDNGWYVIGSSGNDAEIAERVNIARSILKENAKSYSWLTERGPFVILQNGMEFAATYIMMLMMIIARGSGKLSVDYVIDRMRRK